MHTLYYDSYLVGNFNISKSQVSIMSELQSNHQKTMFEIFGNYKCMYGG